MIIFFVLNSFVTPTRKAKSDLTSPEDSSSKYLRASSVEEQADIYDEFDGKRSFSHFIWTLIEIQAKHQFDELKI